VSGAVRRVYRASATYDDPRLDVTRHFLSKRARDSWADRRRAGYDAEPGGFLDDGRPAIPPARSVTVATSAPVTFPDDDPKDTR
jgi:hypothetical protein